MAAKLLTTKELLNMLAEKFRTEKGPASAYLISKKTSLTEGIISNWRTGRSLPDDNYCILIADLLDLDARVVLASIHAERAERTHNLRVADAWKKIAAAAAIAAFAAVLPMQSPSAAPTDSGSINIM